MDPLLSNALDLSLRSHSSGNEDLLLIDYSRLGYLMFSEKVELLVVCDLSKLHSFTSAD